MKFKRRAKPTLSAVEMNHGDELSFTLVNGNCVEMKLLDTGARILHSTLKTPGQYTWRGRVDYSFHCELEINGRPVRIEREIPTSRSFYEPLTIDGMTLWFDAALAIFEFLREEHGPCRPHRHARFAMQDASLSIAPEKIHPWCPLPPGGLNINDCYHGDNCWLGAYCGTDAHGGLDINHPNGTPLYLPIDVDWQYLFHRLENGDLNNRWRGIRFWEDGSVWMIRSAHMGEMLIPDQVPVKAGTQYALAAGAAVFGHDSHEHSHFAFSLIEPDEDEIWLDPWILFRQMYIDNPTREPVTI
jgi:hypothetical protein